MPIRINLLAEAQAIEQQRQRDPVKRVILAGIVLVLLILAWSSSLWVQIIIAKGDLTRSETSVKARASEYAQILQAQKMLIDDKLKLGELHRLATNRFLVGNLLNALQQADLNNVQLVRLKVSQTYVVTPEVKAKTEDGQRISAKAPTATEKIVLTLNAKDTSSVPGDAVNKFRDTLSSSTYFKEMLGKMDEFRLTTLGTPQTDPDGKSFVLFTLEARFPEKTR